MKIVDDFDGWGDAAPCEAADETTSTQGSTQTWCTWPTTRELDEMLANPPPGGWLTADDSRRLVLTTTYPWLFRMVTSQVRGRGAGGRVGSAWAPDLFAPTPDSKIGRKDRGRARPGARKIKPEPGTPTPPPPGTPPTRPCTCDVTIPPPAYLPVGLLEALPPYRDAVLLAAAIDIVDRLAANEGSKYRSLSNASGRARYGRPRPPKAEAEKGIGRPHTWDMVMRHLEMLGIVEHRTNIDGSPRYRIGLVVNGKKIGGSSMSYRLTERWRNVLTIERVERDATLWVPPIEHAKPYKVRRTSVAKGSDSDAVVVEQQGGLELVEPAHYAHWRGLLRYDLVAAIPFLLQRYGAVLPETIDFESLVKAIEKAEPPEAILAECKPKRPKARKLELGDRVTVKGLKKGAHGKIIGFKGGDVVVVQYPDGTTSKVDYTRVRLAGRTPLEIARARAMHRLKYIWRWQVDGRQWAHRDSSGHRLHNVLASLSKDMRRFVSFDGVDEELVVIDAKNSQMSILASMALKKLGPKGDIVDVVEHCAAGTFYEWTFELAYGCAPKDKDERNRHKKAVMSSCVYRESEKMEQSDLGQALAEALPVFTGFLVDEKTDTSILPCRAQQIEASIWLDQLAPELAARRIPALPIHDSVVVPRSRTAEVMGVLLRLHDEAGIRIKLSEPEPLGEA